MVGKEPKPRREGHLDQKNNAIRSDYFDKIVGPRVARAAARMGIIRVEIQQKALRRLNKQYGNTHGISDEAIQEALKNPDQEVESKEDEE